MIVKAGLKMKSTVCDTQVMIIKGSGEHELSCGGSAMVSATDSTAADPARLQADKAGGTLIGKRYVNADESIEILCVKGGKGSLGLDAVPLQVKQAKALPTSD